MIIEVAAERQLAIELRNALFFTAVENIYPRAVGKLMTMLQGYEECQSDAWKIVGYKYIGALEGANRNFSSSKWVSRILAAVNDDVNGVRESVCEGIADFSTDCEKYGLSVQSLSKAVENYLNNYISRYDLDLFQSLYLPDKQGQYLPITPHEKWNIGIVNPWPGGMSAEAEVLYRMQKAAEDADMNLTMLSNFGHILDPKTQAQTEEIVDSRKLDFVISTHYDTHKCLDSFYYHTLWNPPEIPLNLTDYAGRVTDNYLMNDDYLIYDSGGMSKHLECILLNKPRTIAGASSLTASFPGSCALRPRLENPKMFYCGMNWERVVHHSKRHEGLFKLLDNTGKVRFFGPDKVEAWGGICPWEGYKCYQHPIPFDGFSILKEINDCGICLVLSSDIHRRAGAVTNRAYEACAAGAVIISDDNPFMLKHFKDAALFIRYNKNDPEDTFNQLMDKYEWIISHKDEALSLAKRAQEVFVEKFALDAQLKKVVYNHAKRKEQIKRDLYAEDNSGIVLVTFVLNTQDKKKARDLLITFFQNIRNQYYREILPIVLADSAISDEISAYCSENLKSCKILSLNLFDFKGSRALTDSKALDIAYKKYPHRFYINMRAEEVWFSDHITTLIRSLQDDNSLAAYSGRLFEDKQGYRRTDSFKKITSLTLFYNACPDWLPVPGQILFSSECHNYLPESTLPFLDGIEHWATLNYMKFCMKKDATFSRRMTHSYLDGKFDERASVIDGIMQIRLMQDICKNETPESSLAASTGTVQEVLRVLTFAPSKLLLRIRIRRILLRVIPGTLPAYRRLSEKLQRDIDSFIHSSV